MSTRVGSILGADAAAPALLAGPAAANAQPAAQLDQASTITSSSPEAAGQCLDIYNWGRGPVVQLWDCGSQANQYWRHKI
ncbi:hypothetical protein ACIQOV_30560 [Kitasatospora sp. NPDC091257]|uniref:hypothetical protein n=1 Tax=Kitasatospora sp. NPDC091257 TaxID=3364084 RepID=UPI003804B7FB